MRLQHWIGGERAGAGTGALRSIDPSEPSTLVAEAPTGTAEDVHRAVEAAWHAQIPWAALPGPARAEALTGWAAAIQGRAEELAQAIVREVGKPIGEARGEVGRCVALLRYFAGEAVRPSGEVIPSQAAGALQYSVRQPLGVVGLVTPWNFPLAIPLWKAAPALALGNAVVLKPSEESVLCADLLAETSTHLPPGVFNVVFGAGETGAALVAHPAVRGVSFTGSAEVGTRVAVACAQRGSVKVQTEMGGKNPAIVMRDADLGLAASLVASGAMRFAGQKCTATSRVIVERPVVREFQAALATAIEALPVGLPSDPATAVGPVVSEASRDRLHAAVAQTGGRVTYQAPAGAPGFGVAPTLIDALPPGDPILTEELFGPVLALEEAEDLDHAVALANASPYGLSASLFTRDLALALRYAGEIEAGMVRVNADTTGVDPHAPFGGVKGSSSGTREQGPAARDFYTEVKTVQINP